MDVETNGTASLKHDLLSISIYKPDDKKRYERFLPLELNDRIYTSKINGIHKKKLERKRPLRQEEVDKIIREFELHKRIILTYGSLDERFIKNYFIRKHLQGYSEMKFYNFKHDIIASRFSEGNITKDNLCHLFQIKNILNIHSGIHDCILEWKLFCQLDGKKLIVIRNHVYELTNDYLIPVSYLSTYSNFSYLINKLPKIKISSTKIYEIELDNKVKNYGSNITGIAIEHLINSMLNVEKVDSMSFFKENKDKLRYIGDLPSNTQEIPIKLRSDGTLEAARWEDQESNEFIESVNKTSLQLKHHIEPLIRFIKEEIFNNGNILSQELVIDYEAHCLAVCDLSNKDAILEIKTTYNLDINKFKYQLFFQSRGRNCYVLQFDWKDAKATRILISKVNFQI